jgi:hypothetical protein
MTRIPPPLSCSNSITSSSKLTTWSLLYFLNPSHRFALTIIALSGNTKHGGALFPNLVYCIREDLRWHFTVETRNSTKLFNPVRRLPERLYFSFGNDFRKVRSSHLIIGSHALFENIYKNTTDCLLPLFK